MNTQHIMSALALLLSTACLPTAGGGGDDGGGGGDGDRCGVDEYASGGECVACAEFFENAAGDDPADGDTECDPTVTPGQGRLVATPGAVAFAPADVGATQKIEVSLENVGDTTLTVTAIELTESLAGDDLRELTLDAPPATPLEIEPGAFGAVVVAWTPQNTTPDAATLTLTLEDAAPDTLTVEVTTPSLEPDVVAEPSSVSFGRVEIGVSSSRVVALRNAGGSPLQLADIRLSPIDAADFAVSFPTPGQESNPEADDVVWDASVDPGGSVPVRVTFTPSSNTPQSAELLVSSNDPDEATLRVPLTGNATDEPVVELGGARAVDAPVAGETHALDFGARVIGTTHTQRLQIRNSGPGDLVVDSMDLSGDGAFSIPSAAQLGLPLTLGPDEIREVDVSFTPDAATDVAGTIRLSTNDPVAGELVVRLTGTGSEDACPEAVALGSVVGSSGGSSSQLNASPLQTIRLDGTTSTGDVDRFEWLITQRPTNSTARLTPSNTSPNPNLFLDLTGTYVIELTVYSSVNVPSCDTARVEILVTPDEVIHIQLVWDTPFDADQSDTDGADLDLHYLNSLGTWQTSPYDVYWQNVQPDWGTPNDPTDDPSLDIDDSDGAGPENINHDNPSPNEDFSVGVHYYDDRDLGESYATVRIYINGLLRFEKSNRYLEREDTFWYVADIDGATLDVTNVDTIRIGFP
jgi:hypothetical protein